MVSTKEISGIFRYFCQQKTENDNFPTYLFKKASYQLVKIYLNRPIQHMSLNLVILFCIFYLFSYILIFHKYNENLIMELFECNCDLIEI